MADVSENHGQEAASSSASLHHQDLFLLAIDGGGVRGLSSLYILKRLMESIDSKNPPRPCEYFDMIGGTSTGGLIALMLGRLSMGVDQAIDMYLRLMPDVFTKKRHRFSKQGNLRGRYDSKALENGVKEVLKELRLDEDTLLASEQASCKTFVCATSKHTSKTVVLSSYYSKRRGRDMLDKVKVWEAARATSAATSFFDDIEINDELFVDGATGANCPLSTMWTEAFDCYETEASRAQGKPMSWSLEENTKCLVSIGTGVPSLKPFNDNMLGVGKTLVAIATDTEQAMEEFKRQHPGICSPERFFRFNVEQGLEDVAMDEVSKRQDIVAATRHYCQLEDVHKRLKTCAEALDLKQRKWFHEVLEKTKVAAQELYSDCQNIESARAEGRDFNWVLNTSICDKWLNPGRESCEVLLLPHLPDIASLSVQLINEVLKLDGGKPFLIYLACSRLNVRTGLLSGTTDNGIYNVVWALISQLTAQDPGYTDPKTRCRLSPENQTILRDLCLKPVRACMQLWESARLLGLLKDCLQSTPGYDALLIIESLDSLVAKDYESFLRTLSQCLPRRWRVLITAKAELLGSFSIGRVLDYNTEYNEFVDALIPSYSQAHSSFVHLPVAGTNQWIFNHPQYLKWSEKGGILWVSGKPGSGKSVLSKGIQVVLEQRFRKMGSICLVAHWSYSQRGRDDFQRHNSMLRSVLHSLFTQHQPLFKCAEAIYRRNRKAESPWLDSQSVLLEIFELLLSSRHTPAIYLLIDGIDESENGLGEATRRNKILSLVERVVDFPNTRTKVILSSRPIPEIELKFRRCHHIILERENQGDIEKLVETHLISLRKTWRAKFAGCDQFDCELIPTLAIKKTVASRSSFYQEIVLTDQEEAEIVRIRNHLVEKSQGVILWVILVAQELERLVLEEGFSFYELRRKLLVVPSELQEYYKYILMTIPLLWKPNGAPNPQGISKAQKMIVWTIGASTKGAVLLEHLLEAIAIPDEDEVEDIFTCDDDPMLLRVMVIRNDWNYFRRQLYSYCGPFLEVIPPVTLDESLTNADTYNNTKGHWVVRLLHQSCRDFLSDRHSAGPLHVAVGNAESDVDKLGLRYLQIVLPSVSTNYAPMVSIAAPGSVKEIIDSVRYIEHHSLLEFVFTTISKSDLLRLDARVSAFLQQTTSREVASPLAGYLFNPEFPFDSADSHAACTTNYIDAACIMGLTTAVRALLALLSLRDDIWLKFGASILRRLLSVAMELNFGFLITPILKLYIPRLKTPSLVSILPTIEEAAKTGHPEIISSLFEHLLRDFDYVSNVHLIEREQRAWLCDAEEARAWRANGSQGTTFRINLVSESGAYIEIKRASVEKCIRLIVDFAKKKRLLMTEGDSILRAPKSVWQHLCPASISPCELPDSVPVVLADENVEPEPSHRMDRAVLANEIGYWGDFTLPENSEKPMSFDIPMDFDLDSDEGVNLDVCPHICKPIFELRSRYAENPDINSWLLDGLFGSRRSICLYGSIAATFGVYSVEFDDVFFAYWYSSYHLAVGDSPSNTEYMQLHQ